MTLAGLDHAGALYIGGDWVSPPGETTEDVVNPATEEVIASLPVGEMAECDAALAAARRGLRGGTVAADVRGRALGDAAADARRPDRPARRADRAGDDRDGGAARAGGRPPRRHDARPLRVLRPGRRLARRRAASPRPHRPPRRRPAAGEPGAGVRALRRGGRDQPVQLPAPDQRGEDRPGDGDGQHGRAEAVAVHAARGLRAGRGGRAGRGPGGGPQRRHRRHRGRPGAHLRRPAST